VPPAAGTSIVSLLWSALAAGLAARIALAVGAGPAAAVAGALVYATSRSAWVNGSIAEVHGATMAFTAACLALALSLDRGGRPRTAALLALAFAQGVLHMRAVLFLAPALAVLAWPRRGAAWAAWRPIAAAVLLSPLVYAYMPLRERMGATWTFGQTSTWRGLREMVLDTKAERIVSLPAGAAEWAERLATTGRLVRDDVALPLLFVGLLAAALAPAWLARRRERDGGADPEGGEGDGDDGSGGDDGDDGDDGGGNGGGDVARAWRAGVALTLAWLPYAALCLIIWEGRVSDALLAVKLPVALIAGVGVALALTAVWAVIDPTRWDRGWHGAHRARWLAGGAWFAVLAAWIPSAVANGFFAHALARDGGVQPLLADAAALSRPARPTTLVLPWGRDVWALAYAQGYDGLLPGVRLVDHNADVAAIAAEGDRMVTTSSALHVLDLAWWEERIGPLRLAMDDPGLVTLQGAPVAELPPLPGGPHAVNDELEIIAASIERVGAGKTGGWRVRVAWRATRAPSRDYRVAVQLLAHDPPRGAWDVLAAADREHPVDGWRPTSAWSAGEVVRDAWWVDGGGAEAWESAGTQPVAVRVGAYTVGQGGAFEDGRWWVRGVAEGAEGKAGP